MTEFGVARACATAVCRSLRNHRRTPRHPYDLSLAMSRPRFDNFRSPLAVFCFVGTCAIGLAIDLSTKVWAFRALETSRIVEPDGRTRVFSDTHKFIPGWLEFEVT